MMYYLKNYFLKFLKSLGLPVVLVEGWIEQECYDAQGNLKWKDSTHNGITLAGLAQLALLAGDATALPFIYLANGSSFTPFSNSQTALVAENTTNGFARTAATVSRVTTTNTNDTLQLVATWTATGPVTVEEVGPFTASSGGVMPGRALTGTKTFAVTDVYVLTYKIKFS
jgi:hypothetical protein